MRYHFTRKARNSKTGPIPVTTTSSDTCSDACPLKASGCYASAGGPLAMHWRRVDAGERGGTLDALCARIAALPVGQLWRHNQAGDLPGMGDTIDTSALCDLVEANAGKRGFTYTHKPMNSEANRDIVQFANRKGFTVNLSANTLAHADQLADLGIAPVVTVLPSDASGKLSTPAGRKVVICPATYRDDVTCKSCGLCQRQRDAIVGFPAHGTQAKRANEIANS
jgi:hypothetical protein